MVLFQIHKLTLFNSDWLCNKSMAYKFIPDIVAIRGFIIHYGEQPI